jgi:hypothetical protein
MPLNTAVIRDGEPLKIRWGQFHVAAMVIACAVDSGKGPYLENTVEYVYGKPLEDLKEPMGINPGEVFRLSMYAAIATTPLNDGNYVLKKDYAFGDPADGEIFTLKAGDELIAYRGF